MAEFLVTGGAGFIGSNIVHYLVENGKSVRVIDNLATGNKENIESILSKIDFVEGDITKPEDCIKAVKGVSYILHQAAVPSVPRSVKNPIMSHESISTGTLNLLIAAKDAKIKRFVLAGSSSVYGDQAVDFKSEDLIQCPLSPYAAAKTSCEHYLRAFNVCYELETVTLRYFNVFGPRQNPYSEYSAVIPKFIKLIMKGESPVIYGDGLQARDFTFVENNVKANILAATGNFKANGQVYNIACGESYSIIDLVNEINSILNTDVKPKFEDARIGDVKVSKANISKARKELGYDVSVSFREGLKKTIEWYKNNGEAVSQ